MHGASALTIFEYSNTIHQTTSPSKPQFICDPFGAGQVRQLHGFLFEPPSLLYSTGAQLLQAKAGEEEEEELRAQPSTCAVSAQTGRLRALFHHSHR